MPLIVPCQDLVPGMRLAEAFVFRGRTMLPGGKILSAQDIDLLRQKFASLILKVADPILDSLVEFEDDRREQQIARTARTKIAAAVTEVHQRLADQMNPGGIDYGKSKEVVSEVMNFLAENPVSAALLDRNVDNSSPLADHTSTAFYLSLVLGFAVRDYVVRERQRQTAASHLCGAIAMNLLPLGLGAMFMDIGMLSLSHVFAPGYELTDEDRKRIREHPRLGAEALPDHLPSAVKMIVRTHHENYDGSGYPQQLAGASLHVFTRIVRICDAFAAATGERAFRGAKSAARAIWEMSVGPYRHLYDPVLIKVFTSLIQPFPIGAKVRLADGYYGIVARYNRREPFRPTLVVAFAPDGARLPKDQMATLTPDLLGPGMPQRIVAHGDEEVSFIHEVPPAIVAGDLPPITRLPQPLPLNSLLEAAYP